jgi:2-polyprenyl-3-methyl-5-hydroxy-6-metoxy-1,4-benzoquinol methylase
MNVSQLCGVGLFHPDQAYAGEAMIAGIRAVRIRGVSEEPMPVEEVVAPWDPADEAAVRAGVRDESTAPEPVVRPEELDPYDLYIETSQDPESLRMHLRQWNPWRHEIIFSNGVRTSELTQASQFFVPHLLAKWHVFQSVIPEEAIRGRRVLDVGSNIGHFSLFLRQRYGMEVVGVETNPRDLAVARFLCEVSGLDGISFVPSDANRYVTEEPFDLVLHLGTLDHLKNPALALENAASMLRPDGYLALELQTYKNPENEHLCVFLRPDPAKNETCWWFLGKAALLEMLEAAGFDRIEELLEWAAPEVIGPDMRRLSLIARKPSS